MGVLARMLLLYETIIMGNIFIIDRTNKRFNKTLCLYFLSIIILLCLFGVLNILPLGVWAIVTSSNVLGIYTLIKKVKNKQNDFLKDKLLTDGCIFFTVMFIILSIRQYNKYLPDWDHYTAWSYTTKGMYYFNKIFYKMKYFTFNRMPVPMIFEYFFMKVIGIYKQGLEAFSVQIFCYSMLIPLFDEIKKNKIIKVAISIIILCFPAIFPLLNFYDSAYLDVPMALLAGIASYMYFSKDDSKYSKIVMALSLSALSLIKTRGFYVAGITICTFGIYELYVKNVNNKEKLVKFIKSKEFSTLLILLTTIVVTFCGFKSYFKICNKMSKSSNVEANSINNITNTPIEENALETSKEEDKIEESTSNEKDNSRSVIKSLITTWFGIENGSDDASLSNAKLLSKLYTTVAVFYPVKITLMGCICFLFILSILIYIFAYKNEREEKKREYIGMVIAIFIGILVFTLFMQVAYIKQFSTQLLINHDGLERYMASYLMGVLYIFLAIIINIINKKNEKAPYILLMAIIVIFTPLNSIVDTTINAGIHNCVLKYECHKPIEAAEKTMEITNQNDDIVVICDDSKQMVEALMYRYHMFPYNVKVEESVGEELKNKLKKYNYSDFEYIYILNAKNVRDYLKEKFDIEHIEDNSLYKIENEKIKLQCNFEKTNLEK